MFYCHTGVNFSVYVDYYYVFLAKANINTSLGLLSKRPLKGPGQVFGEGNGTKYGLDTVSHVIECGSFTKPSYGGQRSSKYHG